ncbi:hypothetical protein V2J09_013470 [Rumex salicifolius]
MQSAQPPVPPFPIPPDINGPNYTAMEVIVEQTAIKKPTTDQILQQSFNANHEKSKPLERANEDKGKAKVVPEKSQTPWKDKLIGEEEQIPMDFVPLEFLMGKIRTTFPEGADGDPRVTVDPEVVEVLTASWANTLIIKTLGTIIPHDVMIRRTKELWNPRGTMKVIDNTNGYYLIRFQLEEDYTRVLTEGPWTMFGHYLVVKPWYSDFDPYKDTIAITPVWVKIANLPVHYYQPHVLRLVLAGIGEVLKVDELTMEAGRGRFARVCLALDLSKPLKGSIHVNNGRYLLEYEKLNAICFSCGHFGHFQPYCPTDPENIRKKEEALKKEAGNPNPARRRPVGDEQRGGWMLPKKPVWATRTNAMGKQQKGHSAPNNDSDGQKVARNQGIKGENSGSQPKPSKEVVKEKSPKNDKVWKEVKPKYKFTAGGSAHNLETEAELVEKDCRAEKKTRKGIKRGTKLEK